jgi:MFS family permease
VELGADGGQLGVVLALNTLLANGLQLQGAQWTRRGRTTRRVYASAAVARGSWLLAGAAPAALALAGQRQAALLVFLGTLAVSAVASAAASPAMAARAVTAVSERGRTRYLADRMTATWLGAVLGTGLVTALVSWRPGVTGYAAGFALAALTGLLGLIPYALLLRRAPPATLLSGSPPPPFAPGAARAGAPGTAGAPGASGATPSPRFGVQVAAPRPGRGPGAGAPSAAGAAAAVPLPPLPAPGPLGPAGPSRWRRLARRLGAPEAPALGTLVLSAAILQGGAAMIGPAAPIWLVRELGAPTGFLGTVSLASSLAAMASQRLWAGWIDRAGPDRVLGAAGALAALIPLGWLLVRAPWVAVPVSLFGGLAWGGYSLAMTSRLLQLAPPAERPAYLGTYAAAIGAASAAGSLAAGALTTALPVPWVPLVFVLSFLTRGLGWRFLSRTGG